jgi:hypothetical protein
MASSRTFKGVHCGWSLGGIAFHSWYFIIPECSQSSDDLKIFLHIPRK